MNLHECLKCSLEKSSKSGEEKCSCNVKETNFYYLPHDSLKDSADFKSSCGYDKVKRLASKKQQLCVQTNNTVQKSYENLLNKNLVGKFALEQHRLGVRSPKLQALAHEFADKKFHRSVDEQKKEEEFDAERQEMRELFQQVLHKLELNGPFERSLEIEELLESSVFKILVKASARSPINVKNVRSSSRSSGSGFLVDLKNRYIATNGHVIKDADLILVESAGNTENQFEARVVKVSFDLDIAIIQIVDNEGFDAQNYKELELCRDQENFIEKIVKLKTKNCSTARLTRVFAVGYPLGSSTFQIAPGVISGFEGISDEPVIQITAPISHGSSGGALLNAKGQVIGVTSSGIPIGENIGFAIPVQSVINVLDALKNDIAKDMLVLKLPLLGLDFVKNTKDREFPQVEISEGGEIQLIFENDKQIVTPAGQPGILIKRVDDRSIFNNPIGNNGVAVQPFDRLVELGGFVIDDLGNTGAETHPRNMPLKFIFRSLKFGQVFSAKFVRNGKQYENQYRFDPISPEEDSPIRIILKEELLSDETLREEFSPFSLHEELVFVRINSDFISLVGEALPELQQYKETSLIKEPLLILLNDPKKFIEKPEILDTINGVKVRTKKDAEKFKDEQYLTVKTIKGNITFSEKPMTQQLNIEMFKKLFMKK